jgi:hypothetical protein
MDKEKVLVAAKYVRAPRFTPLDDNSKLHLAE